MMSPPQGFVASSEIPSKFPLNVLDYGADPTQTKDSAAAFNAAISAANLLGGGTGGTVYVPSGKYLINSALTVKSGVAIRGAGPAASYIYLNYNGVLFDCTNAANFYIGHLLIRGIGTGSSGSSAIAIKFSNSLYGTIEVIYGDNLQFGTFIDIESTTSIFNNIVGCWFSGSPAVMINGGSANVFLDCELVTPVNYNPPPTAAVVVTSNAGDTKFTYCTLQNAVAAGTTLSVAGPDTLIWGCYIGDAGTGATIGITMAATATKTHVLRCGFHGYATAINVVSGAADCHIQECSQFSVTTFLTNAGTRTSVQGCVGYNPGLGAISLLGLDNRTGLVAADGAPITLFAVPAGAGQLFRISADIFATAVSAGTANYTITWTENAQAKTMVVSASVVNTLATATDLINADASTNITAQLTFAAFTGTVKVASAVEQLA